MSHADAVANHRVLVTGGASGMGSAITAPGTRAGVDTVAGAVLDAMGGIGDPPMRNGP